MLKTKNYQLTDDVGDVGKEIGIFRKVLGPIPKDRADPING